MGEGGSNLTEVVHAGPRVTLMALNKEAATLAGRGFDTQDQPEISIAPFKRHVHLPKEK